jgi:hypothetical protein
MSECINSHIQNVIKTLSAIISNKDRHKDKDDVVQSATSSFEDLVSA